MSEALLRIEGRKKSRSALTVATIKEMKLAHDWLWFLLHILLLLGLGLLGWLVDLHVRWLLLSGTTRLKPRASVISNVPQQGLHVVEMFATATADRHAVYTKGFTTQGADL